MLKQGEKMVGPGRRRDEA